MVLFNIFIFILVVRKVVFRPILSTTAQRNKRRERINRIQQFVLFWVLLGLSWSFGFLALIPKRKTFTFELLFCISTSTQGIVLFIFITIKNPEVRKKFHKARTFLRESGSYEVTQTGETSARSVSEMVMMKKKSSK